MTVVQLALTVVDAGILIAHLDGSDVHHERTEEVLVEFLDDGIGASVMTLAEVLVAPARAGKLDGAIAAIREMSCAELPFSPGAAGALARLRAETGLKIPDRCMSPCAQ